MSASRSSGIGDRPERAEQPGVVERVLAGARSDG